MQIHVQKKICTVETSDDAVKLPSRSGIFCKRWHFHVSCKLRMRSKWEPNPPCGLALRHNLLKCHPLSRETAGTDAANRTIIQSETEKATEQPTTSCINWNFSCCCLIVNGRSVAWASGLSGWWTETIAQIQSWHYAHPHLNPRFEEFY